MSLEGSYDPDNVFARILRGDLPAARVYDDRHVCAFLDAFPQARGHTLVVPRGVRARNLLDCPPESLTTLFRTAQLIGHALILALRPDGLTLTQFNGASAGQTVFHPHIHLIPRWDDQSLRVHGDGSTVSIDTLTSTARAIAAHGVGDGFVTS